MSLQIQLSVLTKLSGLLTKQLSLINGKVISDASECRMSGGLAERISINFQDLPQLINSLSAGQALTTGWVQHPAPTTEIITREKFEENSYVFPAQETPHGVYATRTLSSMGQQGPSLIMFDHDFDENSPHKLHTPEQFIAALSRVIPDFDKISFVRTYSTSSGVYHRDTHECLRPADGYHIYMVIADGSDLQRFGEVLEKRLWLAGFGYIKVSGKNGAMLKRSIVDTAVFSPERLAFEAGAVVTKGHPLYQRRPQPEYVVKAIDMLDTSRLENLSDAEEAQYEAAVKQAQGSDSVQSARRLIKEQLVEKYLGEASKQGKFITRRMAEKMVEALERHVLPPYHTIMLSDGTPVTIAELVSNPFKFDGRGCFDPLRPDKGPDRAKFFGNVDQAVPNPVIYSFVEGGRVFSLRDSLQLLNQYSNEDQADDLKQIADRFITQTNPYFKDFEVFPGITLVRGEKGTGKTTKVAELITELAAQDDASILAITHRVSLTSSLAKSFDLACYNERDISAPHVLRSQRRLGICYDSLHKIAAQTYKIVVIDEVTQMMRHIKSRSVKNKFICLNVLRSIVQNAEYVILMDADLSLPFIELLRDATYGCIRPRTPLNVVINKHLPAKAQGRKARVYTKDEKPDEEGWSDSLIHHAKDHGTFVATNSKNHAYRVANVLAKHLGYTGDPISSGHFMTEINGRRLITMTSDNTADEDAGAFISNLNSELRDTDILIASPSMGTGVSINAVDGKPKFSKTFGRFSRRAGNTSGDCSQHLARVRECTKFELLILDTPEFEDVDPATIVDREVIQRVAMIDRQVTMDERFSVNFDPVTRNYVFADAGWSHWLGQLTALENLDRNSFHENILSRLEQEGYTVETLSYGLSEEAAKALKAEGKELSTLQKEHELKLLLEEPLITDEELEALESQIALTIAEKRQLEKRLVADTFGAYDEKLLNTYLAMSNKEIMARKNGLVLGMFGETLFITDLINRLDPERNHIEKTLSFNKWTFIWQLGDLIGLSRDNENLPTYNGMVISPEIRDCLYEFLWNNRKDIKVLFNKGIKSLHKAAQTKDRHRLVATFLASMGLKLKRVQRGVGNYVYLLDEDNIEQIREEILRARQHSPHTSYKVITTAPKFLMAYLAQSKAGTPEKVPHIHRYVMRLTPYHSQIFAGFVYRMFASLDIGNTNETDVEA